MKKKIILSFTSLLIAFSAANAQLDYNFTVQTVPYQALTGTTSINGSTIWDDENYKVPLGFNFKMNGGNTITHFNLSNANMVAEDTSMLITGFIPLGADLWDRGNVSGAASKSPLRYVVTGTAPNRIFKAEFANAGFLDESSIYGTDLDSVNMQVWLYEGSNMFEIHYGNSKVSHPSDYFMNAGPTVGFVKNFDYNMGTIQKLYYLTGNPANPTMDSTSNIFNLGGMTSMPTSGTVYRFAPKSMGVKDMENMEHISVYPTLCTDYVVVNNNDAKDVRYSVISMGGAVVNISGTLNEGKTQVNVSALPAGTYALKLQSAEGSKTVKFTKM